MSSDYALQNLNDEIKRCHQCRLSKTRINVLFPAKSEFRKVYGQVLKADDKKIIPLQHPAAVLHDIFIKKTLVRNYRKLRVLLAS